MAYNSNGSFTHSDVYNMPIYLRRFYLNLLIKTKKERLNKIQKGGDKKQIINSRWRGMKK